MMFWTIISFVTAFSLLTTTGDSDVDNLTEAALQPQEVNIDRPVVGIGDPISTNLKFPSTSWGWISYMWKSITIQGPWWPEWAIPIRNFMLVIGAAFAIVIVWRGVSLLASFIPSRTP